MTTRRCAATRDEGAGGVDEDQVDRAREEVAILEEEVAILEEELPLELLAESSASWASRSPRRDGQGPSEVGRDTLDSAPVRIVY